MSASVQSQQINQIGPKENYVAPIQSKLMDNRIQQKSSFEQSRNKLQNKVKQQAKNKNIPIESIRLDNPPKVLLQKQKKSQDVKNSSPFEAMNNINKKSMQRNSNNLNNIYLKNSRLKQIRQQKFSTIQKIKNIYAQQYALSAVKRQQVKQKITLQRSILKQEEKNQIKNILKRKKLQEKKLQEKIQTNFRIEKQEHQRQKKKAADALMAKQLQKRQKLLNKKRSQISQPKRCSQIIKKMSSQLKYSYIHIENEKKDRQLKQIQQSKIKKLLSINRQRMKTDFSQIIKFQSQYSQIKKKLSTKKFSIQRYSSMNTPKYQQNSFSKMIRFEEELAKYEQQKKQLRRKEYLSTISKYEKYVKAKFTPKISQNNRVKIEDQDESFKELDKQSIIKIGKQYLAIAKKKRKYMSIKTQENEKSKESPSLNSKRYINYLQSSQSTVSNKNNPEVLFNKLSQTQTPLSIRQAKSMFKLAQKIDVKHKLRMKNMQMSDFYQAKNKIKLLDAFYKTYQL